MTDTARGASRSGDERVVQVFENSNALELKGYAGKTANVNVRVEQNIKEQAEEILERLGISASTFINMTYRQVIMRKGIPFDVTLQKEIPTRDAMTDAEFDKMMSTGLAQAKAGDSIPYDDAFDSLLRGL